MDRLKSNQVFLIPYIIVFILGIIILSIYGKENVHLFINRFHSKGSDIFFKYITYLGDGILIVVFSFVLLLYKIRTAIQSLIIYLGSGLIVQILKRFIFDHTLRPVKAFEGLTELYLVEGVKIHHYKSMPSGHTASAFGFFLLVAVICPRNYQKFICLVLALLTGFSRMYLSEHFFGDVLVGSFIGVVSTLIVVWAFWKKNNWLDNSLPSLLKKRIHDEI